MSLSILISGLHHSGSWGCSGSAENSKVPYALTRVNQTCDGLFDTTINITRDSNSIILTSENSGFFDATGVPGDVERDTGSYVTYGTLENGAPMNCYLTFIGNQASGQCTTNINSHSVSCSVTYTKK